MKNRHRQLKRERRKQQEQDKARRDLETSKSLAHVKNLIYLHVLLQFGISVL